MDPADMKAEVVVAPGLLLLSQHGHSPGGPAGSKPLVCDASIGAGPLLFKLSIKVVMFWRALWLKC